MDLDLSKGDELLRFIEDLDDLEWAKFESRYVSIQTKHALISEDRSAHPPYTCFRFRDEKQEIVDKLAFAVESYSGEIEWLMVGREREFLGGKNWKIYPRKVFEITPLAIASGAHVWKYFAENYPEFGPKAYADLLNLVDHIEKIFLSDSR